MTKNLTSGEGGAILTNDDELAEKLYAFHNNCRPPNVGSFTSPTHAAAAANFRMTEFQGACCRRR